jgi:hypothetical protein
LQGILWTQGVASIEDFKQMNRPQSEHRA